MGSHAAGEVASSLAIDLLGKSKEQLQTLGVTFRTARYFAGIDPGGQ